MKNSKTIAVQIVWMFDAIEDNIANPNRRNFIPREWTEK